MNTRAVLVCVALAVSAAGPAAAAGSPPPVHALAMHGDVKYPANFKNFEYVNPNAPKGGEVKLASWNVTTFDSLNPFILKGIPAAGIGLTFDTLTVGSEDEPFTRYGLVAEAIETPPDRSWVTFTLRKEARFHDGTPVKPEDVIFTFETLKAKGAPFYRTYYGSVLKAEKVGDRKVRFTFARGENRELPLIVGELPVLSRKYWNKKDFTKTTLDASLGSGPYRVEKVDAGRSVTYRRVADYWAANLAVSAGRYNFDRIRFDYYRDSTVALEAFKAGDYDFRQENTSKLWATGYDSPALRQGLVKKEEIPNEEPTGMQGYVYNTRRPYFRDRKVREALAYAFDFEWTNKNLFYGAYTRTRSYFSNSELASSGLPGKEELELLQPFRGRVPEEVFTKEYRPPETDGSGNLRENLTRALQLLEEAGWKVDPADRRLKNAQNGQPLEFEILLDNPMFERITLPFARNLERLGIKASVRTVDDAQYQNRVDKFDFDMTVTVFGQSLSPGNEQRDYWTSEKAEVVGSRNLAGVRDPAVDGLVAQVISAPDRPSLVYRTRALDRVLQWGFYVIPHWHVRAYRVAFWDRFARPAVSPKYALGFLDAWWVDPALDRALAQRRGTASGR